MSHKPTHPIDLCRQYQRTLTSVLRYLFHNHPPQHYTHRSVIYFVSFWPAAFIISAKRPGGPTVFASRLQPHKAHMRDTRLTSVRSFFPKQTFNLIAYWCSLNVEQLVLLNHNLSSIFLHLFSPVEHSSDVLFAAWKSVASARIVIAHQRFCHSSHQLIYLQWLSRIRGSI